MAFYFRRCGNIDGSSYNPGLNPLLDCWGWSLAVCGWAGGWSLAPMPFSAEPRQTTEILCHTCGGAVKSELRMENGKLDGAIAASQELA